MTHWGVYCYIHCLQLKPDPDFSCPNAPYVLVLYRESLSTLLLMRVKGYRAVCLEEAGSPRPTQSLTRALYLNQASGTRLHLLTTSWLLISFCVVLFVSLSLVGVWGLGWGGVGGLQWPKKKKKRKKRCQAYTIFLYHGTESHNRFFQSYYKANPASDLHTEHKRRIVRFWSLPFK